MRTRTVTQVVCNSTLPCSDVSQVCILNGKIYTDTNARMFKQYNPDDNSVRVSVGSCHNSSSNRTQDPSSFKQIEGICSIDFVC